MLLTEAQHETLKKMPFYHIVAHLDTGAVVVVFDRAESVWVVIDRDGRVFAFSRYLESISHKSQHHATV
jgi:hypothetical protein